VILLKEEIVVIDLLTDSWPLYHLPYLNSIHDSPVICTTFASNINQEFYKKLVNYAAIQLDDYSDRVCRRNVFPENKLKILLLEMADNRWRGK
jgi:hypothetical protein